MSSFSQLIKDLENNFKTDLSPTTINFNLPNVQIKLYNTEKLIRCHKQSIFNIFQKVRISCK